MATRRFVLIAFSVLALAACRKAEVASYRIPKEAAPAHPAMTAPVAAANDAAPAAPTAPDLAGPMPPGHPAIPDAAASAAPAPVSALTWTAPAHWKAKPLGTMRRGSFDVPGEGGAVADLSIFVFPGAAGGVIDNVNRWRGQIGLPPLDASQLAAEITVVKSDGGLDLTVVDMAGNAGAQRERLLGAILSQGNESWFFKLKGPDQLVAKEKPAFLAFLQSVKTP